MAQSFDAIVIGSGPGGCVMARRLSESGRRVLLVEAGPGLPLPASVQGLDTVAANQEPTRRWPGLHIRPGSVPGLRAHKRAYRQGRSLGGGSVINSMLLTPGDSHDYRRWEERAGCQGWGPDQMAPWLAKATERFAIETVKAGPLTAAFAEASVAAGHPKGGSSLDGDAVGVLTAALAAKGRNRWSAIDAYLTDVDGSLTVITGAFVERLILNGKAIVGIELGDGDQHLAPLVVVSAGALQTPNLLNRSNIVAPPGGYGLKDHPSFVFTVRLRKEADDEGRDARPRAVSQLLRWSSAESDGADLQAFVLEDLTSDEGPGERQNLAIVAVALMEVRSKGLVSGEGSDLGFDPAALTDPEDRQRFRQGVRHVAALLRSDPVAEIVEDVFIDDSGTSASGLPAIDDDELDRWLLTHPGPYAHVATSCPLGLRGGANTVVSCEPGTMGALTGYHGIVLADSSVLPDLVGGGLQLPVAAVAERIAADVIDR